MNVNFKSSSWTTYACTNTFGTLPCTYMYQAYSQHYIEIVTRPAKNWYYHNPVVVKSMLLPESTHAMLDCQPGTHLFHSLGAVVFQFLRVHGVKGCVEALACVQGDGVLVPWTYHTQPTVGVLYTVKRHSFIVMRLWLRFDDVPQYLLTQVDRLCLWEVILWYFDIDIHKKLCL